MTRCYEKGPFFVPLFVLALTVLSPILGREHGRYLLALYVVIFPWVLSRPIPKPHLVPFLYVYITANVFALIAHLNVTASVLNAGSLLISVVAIAGAAYSCVRNYGTQRIDRAMERWLWVSFVLSLFFSVALTGAGWATAPSYFPWEAFYSEERLLLINDEGVGHTPSLWVIAFLAAFTIHRICIRKSHRIFFVALLGLLVVCLLATKSRLSIIYMANLLVMGLAYKKLPLARAAVALIPAAFAVFFLSVSIMPQLGAGLDVAARSVQQTVGNWLRLTPGEDTGATVFAGRDILNQALVSASLSKPLAGQGDDADILAYGVDDNGDVAYDPDRMQANTESPLRLSVKYGWLYFAMLLLFLGSIPFAIMQLPMHERILKLGLWGMCVESIVSQGGMEVFYNISGLMLFMLCIFLFEATFNDRVPRAWPKKRRCIRRSADPGRVVTTLST